MKKITSILLTLTALSTLNQQLNALSILGSNAANKPITIRLYFVGETHWPGAGCTLCPNEHHLPAGPSKVRIDFGAKLISKVEVFETQIIRGDKKVGKLLASRSMLGRNDVTGIFYLTNGSIAFNNKEIRSLSGNK